MKKAIIALFILSMATGPFVHAQHFKSYLVESLDILVAKTLEAYNLENHLSFYEYFADKMEPITEAHHFTAVYMEGYKKVLGDCYARELIPEESVLDPDYPVLVYRATFQKYVPVRIIINFVKEFDNYRISQIRFDKIHEELGTY